MPPPTPLHASERKLGWFMLAAIPLAVTMGVLGFGIGLAGRIVTNLAPWVRQQWGTVLGGSWPPLSINDSLQLMRVSLFVGAFILVPWHLCHLFGQRRPFSQKVLWLWSGLYGLVPAGFGGLYLFLILSAEASLMYFPPRFIASMIGELVLGLAIVVFGFRAWLRRRREDRAAPAADPAA